MSRKITVLGVSAGNGVMLYPFEKSKHFKVIGNFEHRAVFHTKEEEQWYANFKSPIYRDSVEAANNLIGVKPDVIVGHPDCGYGSRLRYSRAKKLGDYAKNDSLAHFLAHIDFFKPKVWLLENLQALLKHCSEEELRIRYKDYRLVFINESVSVFGNSQKSRKRLVIVGIRREIRGLTPHLQPFLVASPKFSENFELPDEEDVEACHIYEPWDKTANLIYKDKKKITYKLARKVWRKKFKGKSKWYVGGKMVNQPGVNRNLKGRYPLTVRKQNRQFTTSGRVLSPREMANIQGVPRDFILYCSDTDNPAKKIYWINKARTSVTKTAPYEVGLWLCKILKRKRRKLF